MPILGELSHNSLCTNHLNPITANEKKILQIPSKPPVEEFGVMVTGFSHETTEEDLFKHFQSVGTVRKAKIHTKNAKRSANIFYCNEEDQRKATRKLHETQLRNTKLNVTKLIEDPSQLFDVYISGHPPNATNEQIQTLLEAICDVPCIRVTNKQQYCFYQVEGKDNYEKALQLLNGAVTSTGHRLISQPSRKKRSFIDDSKKTKLAEMINIFAENNGIIPTMETTDMYFLERSVRTVHVSGLPPNMKKEELSQTFEAYGTLEDIEIIYKHGYQNGFGFVVYADHAGIKAYRKSNFKSVFVGSTPVRVTSSKPSRNIVRISQLTGLLDIDANPTGLFFQLLDAAIAALSAQENVITSGLTNSSLDMMYLQDPTTGSVYAVTPMQYQSLLLQEAQYKAQKQCIYQQRSFGNRQRFVNQTGQITTPTSTTPTIITAAQHPTMLTNHHPTTSLVSTTTNTSTTNTMVAHQLTPVLQQPSPLSYTIPSPAATNPSSFARHILQQQIPGQIPALTNARTTNLKSFSPYQKLN